MMDWVVCNGSGYVFANNKKEKLKTNFAKDAVGLVREKYDDEHSVVWLIGTDTVWVIQDTEFYPVDVLETGDKFQRKICNVCHCLKPIDQFAPNQNNKHGQVRRPSCKKCRTDIDKRAPKTRQAKEIEKQKPAKGSHFVCPICRKRSIVGVTAKIVADHDHHTGNIRDFICDSCNTGLGRFKNGENYLMNAVNYIKERDALGH